MKRMAEAPKARIFHKKTEKKNHFQTEKQQYQEQ